MKTIILLITIHASLITFHSSAQGVSNSILDSGYKVLRINKKYDEVKQYLVKIDKKDLWDTAKSRGIGGQFTSGWTVNLKKAGMETFFGLKVDRIEVYFNGELDKNDKPYDTDIFCFTIYCVKPSNEKDADVFRAKMFDYYGTAEIMFSEDHKTLIHNTWFTTITMFTAIYGVEYFTNKKLKYYEMHFEQGYGG
jgi:hypothetical protein